MRASIVESVAWRRQDTPGTDAVCVTQEDAEWHLWGAAAFVESGAPCALQYHVTCDAAWRTIAADVMGFLGDTVVVCDIRTSSAGGWTLNGQDVAAVQGCPDLDFEFSPVTNLLAIRRLGLAIGERGVSRAAWLRFPALALEPLEQTYHRIAARTFDYTSQAGAFRTTLETTDFGLVLAYPPFWEAVAHSP